MPVHLHPQHLRNGKLYALKWQNPPEQRAERLSGLVAKAAEQPHSAPGQPGGEAPEVFRTQEAVIFRADGLQDVVVPMLLAEVGYAQQGSDFFVAFGSFASRPPLGAASSSDARPEASCREYEVWLMCVTGGRPALQAFLRVLSKGGVARCDVEWEYAVPRAPFAFGASSSIYKVQQLVHGETGKRSVLGCELAAKVLVAQRRGDVRKVDKEVQMLCMAQGHPNVVKFRGFFVHSPELSESPDGGAFGSEAVTKAIVLTDYHSTGSLWSRVKCNGVVAECEAVCFTAGLMSALAHIHRLAIVHRDVKSENVLWHSDGRAILTDFGIACSTSDAEALKVRCGTIGYAAPETVCPDVPYGQKVDVFGAGVTLYFAIFARTPFGGADCDAQKVLRRTAECRIGFPEKAQASEKARRVMQMFLARSPEDRPSSRMALEVLELLDHSKLVPGGTPSGRHGSKAAPHNKVVDSLTASALPSDKDRSSDLSQPLAGSPRPMTPSAQRRRPSFRQIFSWSSERQQPAAGGPPEAAESAEAKAWRSEQSHSSGAAGIASAGASHSSWWTFRRGSKAPPAERSDASADAARSAPVQSAAPSRGGGRSSSWAFRRSTKASSSSAAGTYLPGRRGSKQVVSVVP